MGFRPTTGTMCLLAGAAAFTVGSAANLNATNINSTSISTTAPRLSLRPVSDFGSSLVKDGSRMAPQKQLNLTWQTPNLDSAVSVGVHLLNVGVVLENIADVAAVDCTGQASVAVTFKNDAAYREAFKEWSAQNNSFVLITNHMGDCDTELERSFFLADSDTLASFDTNLTIVAKAEKSSLVDTALSTSIDFTSVASNLTKRGIKWNEDSLNFGFHYQIPGHQIVVDTSYLAVTVKELTVNNTVRYSGHAKWEVFKGVTEFYLDVEKDIDHYVDMDIKIKDPWSDTWSWAPLSLEYSVIDVPGIISLGPSAGISLGASLTATVAGDINGQFSSKVSNGSVHVDFLDWEASSSQGWTPEYDAVYNTSETAQVVLKPYVDFTVEFACKLFGGVLDLSTGVTAEPAFPIVSTASLTQSHNSTAGTVTYPNSTALNKCPNGVSADVSFNFAVTAFATKYLSMNLYNYNHDLWNRCVSFLGAK